MRFPPVFGPSGRFVLFLAAVALFALVLGCSGDELEALEFDFSDLPDEEADAGPPPTVDPFARLFDHDQRELRLAYLHDVGAVLYQVERSRRDIVKLIEDALSEPTDLDWVVDAHTAHRSSEELRLRAYSYPLPEEIAEDYITFHAAFLETVQLYAFAADRLLGAAILLGPSGRISSDMLPAESSDYRSMLTEGMYYLLDAELLLTRAEDDLKQLLKDMRVR